MQVDFTKALFEDYYVCILVMGKAEGGGEKWHGHVTALTVAPEFRRLGLAGTLMNNLEQISEQYVLIQAICISIKHKSFCFFNKLLQIRNVYIDECRWC